MGDRQRGASAVEYALLVAGIALLCLVVGEALVTLSRAAFKDQCDSMGTQYTNAINADLPVANTKC